MAVSPLPVTSSNLEAADRAARNVNGPLGRMIMLLMVLGPFAATLYAILQLWQRAVVGVDLALLGIMYLLISLGVTVGYHRYLTHRSFKAPAWLKVCLLILGSMGVEGPALRWASTHLEHHAHADREGDPHSPLAGFWHAHAGWIVDGFRPDQTKYGQALATDRIVVMISRTFFLWVALSLLIPAAVDGWRGLLWGGIVRIFLVHHVTWSVNSVCHVFGRRPFKTGDRSTNNWLVGLLAGGEGYHNNHHAFQRSAFHGLHWWQFDLSGLLIRLFEILGVATEVQRVSPELIRKRLREGGE